MHRRLHRGAAVACALAVVACAPATPSPPVEPAAPPAEPLGPPPIPLVEGPLEIRVVYPRDSAVIAARDSNFIFGSVGTGRASLTINGVPVTVHPNGAFLAFLPVPPAEAPFYELVAVTGTDTARVVHPVRVLPPRLVLADTGVLLVDTASLAPGDYTLRPAEEPVRVSVRAPANATVWVETAEGRFGLSSGGAGPGVSQARGGPSALPSLRYRGDPTYWARELPARLLATDGAAVVIARGADTVRLPILTVDAYDAEPPWAILGADSSIVGDTDRVVTARPVPGGTYKWLLLPGTIVRMTGQSGAFTRVRLDDALEVWVNGADVRVPMEGFPPPRRIISNLRVIPHEQWVDVVFPIGERPPFLVEEDGDALVLTFYGTRANTDIIRFAGNDSLVRHVTWEQVSTDRAQYRLHLASRPYGWLALFERGAFILRVRRPPAVDSAAPLRGRTIVVDAGHPPAGATGPTGLYEGIPVLDVALRVQRLLEARGATAILTRTTAEPFPLGDRPIVARRANADALVSIHLNALPDGVNPFEAHGTGTYYFHPHSAPLARAVQNGMVAHLGLRDLGIYYDNLALVRPTWMPAILTEGAFIMIPEQEAAVRTPEYREAYALGIVDGLEAFFRALAGAR